jgi:hypothetical protein
MVSIRTPEKYDASLDKSYDAHIPLSKIHAADRNMVLQTVFLTLPANHCESRPSLSIHLPKVHCFQFHCTKE